MAYEERFSVYSPASILQANLVRQSAIGFLMGDYEHGLHVARNLLKPLNHLDFLRRKEEIAKTTNLHSSLTNDALFRANYTKLQDHQQGLVSTDAMIAHLASQPRPDGISMTVSETASLLREAAIVRHMEFHPCDACNLSCCDCTYGHDIAEKKPPPANYPLDEIKRIARLKPHSIVIVGGGEPTLYRDGVHHFQELIDEIDRQIPNAKLALISNGTFKPPGDWPDRLSWIRISLDAATAGTYVAFRGRPLFQRVVDNFLAYLEHDVRVGIGFLFARPNVHEYVEMARFIFELVKRERPDSLSKVYISYRPLRRDCYSYDEPFPEAVSEDQIQQVIRDLVSLAHSSDEMEQFLRNQSNVTAILGGNTHPPLDFSRCYYSQTFKILRANGDLRPCFVRITEPDFIMGNIHTDSLESIGLNTLYVAALGKPGCDARGCRQCHVNYVFEKGLEGKLKPSSSPDVLADPMY